MSGRWARRGRRSRGRDRLRNELDEFRIPSRPWSSPQLIIAARGIVATRASRRYGPNPDQSSRDWCGVSRAVHSYLPHFPMRIRFRTATRYTWPRTRTVHAAGNRYVGTYEYGDPAGAPVFALHGTPSCGAGFDWTDVSARERNLRIIAPDRPGIGRSTAVPMPAVADYAVELAVLADALEIDRFTVLGYSGGGPYALAVAAALGPRVQSAAIVAGAGEIGAWAVLADLVRSDRQMTWLSLHAPALARVALRAVDLGARVAPRVVLWSAESDLIASDRAVLRNLGSPRQALAL